MRRAKDDDDLDCVACGACCYNPDENRVEGYVYYIELKRRDAILSDPERVRTYVVRDEDGIPHMKLDHRQRCVALEGRLGRHAVCTIYEDRPSVCRKFEAGSERCLQYRRERGVDR